MTTPAQIAHADTLTEAAHAYASRPWLRALFQLTAAAAGLGFGPAGAMAGGAAAALDIGVSAYANRRIRWLFDELARGKKDLSDEDIRKEPFVHAFLATTRAATRSSSEVKARRLARMLRRLAEQGTVGDIEMSIFEEWLSILEGMSDREFALLAIMDQVSSRCARLPEENDLQWNNRWWPTLVERSASEALLEEDVLSSVLQRVGRTGLCGPLSAAYWGYEGGRWQPSVELSRFLRYVEETDHSGGPG